MMQWEGGRSFSFPCTALPPSFTLSHGVLISPWTPSPHFLEHTLPPLPRDHLCAQQYRRWPWRRWRCSQGEQVVTAGGRAAGCCCCFLLQLINWFLSQFSRRFIYLLFSRIGYVIWKNLSIIYDYIFYTLYAAQPDSGEDCVGVNDVTSRLFLMNTLLFTTSLSIFSIFPNSSHLLFSLFVHVAL